MLLLPARLQVHRRLLSLIIMVGAAACSSGADTSAESTRVNTAPSASAANPTPADTDDFGTPLPRDAQFAERVVSLNPASTEVIFAMGAEAHLVGRSAWDEHPAEALALPAMGNGIRPNIEVVLRARPTLVILYATPDNRAAAEAFAQAGVRTVALRVDHIAQFESMTRRLGVALGAVERASTVVDSVRRTLDRVRHITRNAEVRTVVWPLWQSPAMVVGRGSYIDELLTIAGAKNVFADLESPSPVVSVEEIARRNPDLIVASDTTRALLSAKPQWEAIAAVRERRWIMHDPTYTGRPSVVLGMAAVRLARALHPELADSLPLSIGTPSAPTAASRARP